MSIHTIRIIRALTLGGFAVAMLVTTVVSAQPPAAQPKPETPAPAQPPPADRQPAEARLRTYNPEGRRDPFISLLGRGNDPKSQGARPAGVPGLLINEINVKGIVRNISGFVALIQGPDNKTYVVKAGDRLMDGTVKSIVQDAVVFTGCERPAFSGEAKRDQEEPEIGRRGAWMSEHLPHTNLSRARAATLAIVAAALALASGLSLSAGSAPIRLLGVSAEGTAVVIESTEPAAYVVRRPDALTVVVELLNVSVANATNAVGRRDPIASVTLEQGQPATARPSLGALKPQAGLNTSYKARGNVIRLERSRNARAAAAAAVLGLRRRMRAPGPRSPRLNEAPAATMLDRVRAVRNSVGKDRHTQPRQRPVERPAD